MHLFRQYDKDHVDQPFMKKTYCGKLLSCLEHTVDPWPTGVETFTPGTVCDECEEEYQLYLLGRT